MSVTDAGGAVAPLGSVMGVTQGVDSPDTTYGSLRTRLAAKRRALAEDRTFELPVPGFSDEGIWARYRVLRYEDLRQIGETNKNLTGTDGELAIAADTLAWANVCLLEKQEDGTFTDLGYCWTAEAARILFGVEGIPEGASNAYIFQEIFNGPAGTTNLMLHFASYDQHMQGTLPELDEAMRGELGARWQRASSS